MTQTGKVDDKKSQDSKQPADRQISEKQLTLLANLHKVSGAAFVSQTQIGSWVGG